MFACHWTVYSKSKKGERVKFRVSSIAFRYHEFNSRRIDSFGPWPNGKTTREGGGGLLPYKRPMGMGRWMGWHFHDWIDYNGVAFSTELLEWGRTFSDFWGVRQFFTFTVSKRTRMFVQQMKSKVFFIQYKKWANS